MTRPANDPDVAHEPHLRDEQFDADPSEQTASPLAAPTDEERVLHGVQDEPALAQKLARDRARGDVGYRAWLERGKRRTSPSFTWVLTLGAMLAAGPFAIVGAMMTIGDSAFVAVRLVLLGPLAEEVLKVGLPLLVVERRPYWFRSPLQIVLAALGGGLVFAAVENVLYLRVYVTDPSHVLVVWRWTVCVAMHAGCSLVAGLGVARVWSRLWRDCQRPELRATAPFLAVAVGLHGLYNLGALLLSYADARF